MIIEFKTTMVEWIMTMRNDSESPLINLGTLLGLRPIEVLGLSWEILGIQKTRYVEKYRTKKKLPSKFELQVGNNDIGWDLIVCW